MRKVREKRVPKKIKPNIFFFSSTKLLTYHFGPLKALFDKSHINYKPDPIKSFHKTTPCSCHCVLISF